VLSFRNMKTASLLLILLCISSLPVFSQVKYETEPVSSAVQEKLDQVAGKVLYSCARHGVLMLETKEQVRFYGREVEPQLQAVLSPWKIVGVDKVGDMGGRYLMAIRLNVLGVPMVIGGLVIDPAALTSATDPLQMIADAANLSTTVRGTTGERFTDVDAVMRGEVHSGMTEKEMVCGLGEPDRINSDENSEQNVYRNGNLLVYTSNGRVTNVQHSSQSQ
jgi:hypothetical protein